MKIVQPYATLKNITARFALENIVQAARVSHRSEGNPTGDMRDDIKFLKAVVLDHGDWSVVEHQPAQVEFLVDRGITHEIVRHRLFSFTQESTRFVNYDKKKDGELVNPPSFVYPIPDVVCEHCAAGHTPTLLNGYNRLTEGEDYIHRFHPSTYAGSRGTAYDDNQLAKGFNREVCAYNQNWLSSIDASEQMYKELLQKDGWRPQEARSVFPNALAAKLVMTGNLRAWRWFLLMRTTKEAHPQMKQVTIPLLQQFKGMVPVLFDDIEPNARQIDNARKAH